METRNHKLPLRSMLDGSLRGIIILHCEKLRLSPQTNSRQLCQGSGPPGWRESVGGLEGGCRVCGVGFGEGSEGHIDHFQI